MNVAAPLSWPTEIPRRRSWERKRGPFSIEATRAKDKGRLPLGEAIDRLVVELGNWDHSVTSSAVLSADFRMTKSRNPKVSYEDPPRGFDPGAVLVYVYKGRTYVLPADRYDELAQNVAALAAHLNGQRATARHGVMTLEALMAATELSLAAPKPGVKRSWREVLGAANIGMAEQRYRELALIHHPDVPGGSVERMSEINVAIAEAREEYAT